MLDEQQHSDGFGHSPEIAQHSQERASLSWLLIDNKLYPRANVDLIILLKCKR
jgi:hypothetical protein